MTDIQKLATREAKAIVYQIWGENYVYNKKAFQAAQSIALKMQKRLLREYLNAGGKPSERLYVLKALPKAMVELKYKKKDEFAGEAEANSKIER